MPPRSALPGTTESAGTLGANNRHACAHCSGNHPMARCPSSRNERDNKGPSLWDKERFPGNPKYSEEGSRS